MWCPLFEHDRAVIVMLLDVCLHEIVGQPLVVVAFLSGSLLGDNAEGGVVAASFLKLVILIGAKVHGGGSKLLGHLNGLVLIIDLHN